MMELLADPAAGSIALGRGARPAGRLDSARGRSILGR
jgi:hypothetical protein